VTKGVGPLAAVVAIVAVTCGCGAPPLKTISQGRQVRIDVRTWDEYITSISRIRVTDQRAGTVVWELVADAGQPLIGYFDLTIGDNPVLLQAFPKGSSFRVVTPAPGSGNVFRLEADRPYIIEVWRPFTPWPARATFQLSAAGRW